MKPRFKYIHKRYRNVDSNTSYRNIQIIKEIQRFKDMQQYYDIQTIEEIQIFKDIQTVKVLFHVPD